MKTLKDYLEGLEDLETIESKNNKKMDLIDAYLNSADPADLYDLLADFNITEKDDIFELDESEVTEYLRDHLSKLSIEALNDITGQELE